MILVITLTIDQTSQLVTDLLDMPYMRLDLNANPLPQISYRWDGSIFSASLDGIDLSEVTSVWYRISELTYYNQPFGSYAMLNRKCREAVIFHLYDWLNAYWLSHPYAIERSQDKMFQLRNAVSLGLSVPKTLVTSDPREVVPFRESCGDIIVKPTAKHMVKIGDKSYSFFTNRVSAGMPLDLEFLPNSPAIFQQEIHRAFDVRTIVVGEEAFSIAIHQVGAKKGGVDYRIGADRDLEFEPYKLPEEIQKASISLVKRLGLEFGLNRHFVLVIIPT